VEIGNARKIFEEIELPQIYTFVVNSASDPLGVPVAGVKIEMKSFKNGVEQEEGDFQIDPFENPSCNFYHQNFLFPVEQADIDRLEEQTGESFSLEDFDYERLIELEEIEELMEKIYGTFTKVSSDNPVHSLRNSGSTSSIFSFSTFCDQESFNDGPNFSTNLKFQLSDQNGTNLATFNLPAVVQKIDPKLNMSLVKVQDRKKIENGVEVNPMEIVDFVDVKEEFITVERDHYKFQENCPQNLIELYFEIPNFPGSSGATINSTFIDNANNRAFFLELEGEDPMIWTNLDGRLVASGSNEISYQPYSGENTILGSLTTTPQGKLVFQYNCGAFGTPTSVDKEFTVVIYQTPDLPDLEGVPGSEREKLVVKRLKIRLKVNLIG
jgi:hypothetical protein